MHTSIDSMTVLTPELSFFSFSDINSKLITVCDDTGEVLDSKPKPVIYDKDGIKLRAFKTVLFDKTYITFTVTSKMLKSRYIEGISDYNFFEVFNFLQSVFGFKIEYDRFLSDSIVIDIDFKRDNYETDLDFSNRMLELNRISPYSKIYRKKENYLQESAISGLQFINRKDASITKPFVKFYDKFYELKTRSDEFFQKYLKNSDASYYNLKRTEVTVKNKKHLESLIKPVDKEINVNSLSYILKIDSYTIDTIIDSLILKHYNPVRKIPPPRDISKFMRPRDFFTVSLMFDAMQQGRSMKELFLILEDYPGLNANTKSRIIKDLKSHFIKLANYNDLLNLRVTASDAFFK